MMKAVAAMREHAARNSRLTGTRQRGGALLAVLWLSAALSAIALTLALTVRTELERASGSVDSVRAYFLAEGAIEHFQMLLAAPGYANTQDTPPGAFKPGQRRLRWDTPSGSVDLEITGEGGKLNAYTTDAATLTRLFVVLGIDPIRAEGIAGGIVARRANRQSSFSGQPSSFTELEDLLGVGGMTPDIFYGWWVRPGDSGGAISGPAGNSRRLIQLGGLAENLTVVDSGVNANYASPAVLRAIGVPDGPLQGILQARETEVIENPAGFGVASLGGGQRLVGRGSMAYTVRATAQLRGRPARRTVAALIRLAKTQFEPPVGVVRWYPVGN